MNGRVSRVQVAPVNVAWKHSGVAEKRNGKNKAGKGSAADVFLCKMETKENTNDFSAIGTEELGCLHDGWLKIPFSFVRDLGSGIGL